MEARLPEGPAFEELRIVSDEDFLIDLLEGGWDWVGFDPESGRFIAGRGARGGTGGWIHTSAGKAQQTIGRVYGVRHWWGPSSITHWCETPDEAREMLVQLEAEQRANPKPGLVRLELIIDGDVVETVGPFVRGSPYRQMIDAQALTLFGVLASIGLTVGFGVSAARGPWWGVGGGVAAAVILAVLLRTRRVARVIIRAVAFALPARR